MLQTVIRQTPMTMASVSCSNIVFSGAGLGFLKRGVDDSQLTTPINTGAIDVVCVCVRARHKCSLAS